MHTKKEIPIGMKFGIIAAVLVLYIGLAFGLNFMLSAREPVSSGAQEKIVELLAAEGLYNVHLFSLEDKLLIQYELPVTTSMQDVMNYMETAMIKASEASSFTGYVIVETFFDGKMYVRGASTTADIEQYAENPMMRDAFVQRLIVETGAASMDASIPAVSKPFNLFWVFFVGAFVAVGIACLVLFVKKPEHHHK